MSLGRALSIINGSKNLKNERDNKINEKITTNTKMSLKEYISHMTNVDKRRLGLYYRWSYWDNKLIIEIF